MEAIYERARVNAKAEPNLTFTFTRDVLFLPQYIASFLVRNENFTRLIP